MPPLTVMIKPASSACNMRCAYCFYADVASHRGQPSYGTMSEATLENLVRRAFAYADGPVTFLFQGGDPRSPERILTGAFSPCSGAAMHAA